MPGITYTGKKDAWSWGSQLSATYRTGTNNKGYRWGHRWNTTGWVARQWLGWLSTSLRLDYHDWRGIRGDDDDLNRAVVPTADPDLRAGRRLDLLSSHRMRTQITIVLFDTNRNIDRMYQDHSCISFY